MSVRALLTSVLFLQLLLAASSVEDLTTCKAIWTFKLPCTKPISDLVNQVQAWQTKKCNHTEKCMYEMIKELPTHLEIKHTSPKTGKITQITFNFNPPASPSFCKVMAVSTSPQNATPNDYCLLYNLMDGSGLTQATGYREICNEAMCPSKASATCNTKE